MSSGQTSRTLKARIAALTRWAKTDDRSAGTAAARAAFEASFEARADPLGELEPEERARRAASLRRAHYARLALRSAEKRRRER